LQKGGFGHNLKLVLYLKVSHQPETKGRNFVKSLGTIQIVVLYAEYKMDFLAILDKVPYRIF